MRPWRDPEYLESASEKLMALVIVVALTIAVLGILSLVGVI